MKDKLVELIRYVQYLGGLEEKLADHLIANGVTVQKQGLWRKEGKTVDGNLVLVCPFCLHDRVQQHFKPFDNFCPHCGAKLDIK